jgi:hypothetical protein
MGFDLKMSGTIPPGPSSSPTSSSSSGFSGIILMKITRKSRITHLYDAFSVPKKLYQSVVAGFIRGFCVELFLVFRVVWPLEKSVCALEVTDVHNEEERRLELLIEADDIAEDSLRRTVVDAIEVDDSLFVESRSTVAEGIFDSLRSMDDIFGQ